MAKYSVHNRANRKSGGPLKAKIVVGVSGREVPALSFQCFESRHSECVGRTGIGPFLMNGKCECRCHERKPT